MHHKFGPSMPYQGGEYGLAVLSKFPVAGARVHKLPGGGEPRTALEVEVDIPNAGGSKTRVSFVSVHFDWTSPDDTRLAQASALIEVLRSRKHPVIVAGDFNDVRGSRTLDAFAAEFHLPESAGPTIPADQPRSEIDFITWRGLPRKAELEVIGENAASDHRPVLAAISLAAAAAGARGKQDARLAREILDDRTLREVHQMARKLLQSGLTAGSGYGEVWIRDLNTFIEVALAGNDPARYRESLLTFFKFQGPTGDIVDGYIPKERAKAGYKYRSSSLAPALLAHKNTVETDQESSLVQAICKYIAVTDDRGILDETIDGRTVRERLDSALDYVIRERYDSGFGLVWGATTVDWGDVQPEHAWGVELDDSSHRAIDVYDNAMFIIAIENYLQLVGEESSTAPRWSSVRDSLKQNCRKHLWDAGRHKFVAHLYLDGSPFPPDFDESAVYYHGGTAVAIEAGLLTQEDIIRSLEQMRANVRKAGAGSIGLTVYPPYPEGAFKNPSMVPFGYQNGGDWCWFGGRMVQQLIRHGLIEDAYRELQPMVARVQRVGDFHEWWSRDNQPRGSARFRGSAGVLGLAIEMLDDWAENAVSESASP
jgi:hypothetical protein